jgi:hypothetical protein
MVQSEGSTALELIKQIRENLDQDPANWETRRNLVKQLGENGKDFDGETRQMIFQELVLRSHEDDSDAVRRSAREALRKFWETGWASRPFATLTQALQVLREDPDRLVRQAAVEWVSSIAAEIAKDERMVADSLDALIERAKIDPDPRVKKLAWEASQEIWEASSNVGNGQETYQLAFLNPFLKVLRDKEEDEEDWEIKKEALDWLRAKAAIIAKSDQVVDDIYDTLVERSKDEEKEYIRKSVCELLRILWDESWGTEQNESQQQAVLDLALKALKKTDNGGHYQKVREAAADWLGDKAEAIAISQRMTGRALEALTQQVNKKGEGREARRSAWSASIEIGNEAWENPASRETVLDCVLAVFSSEGGDEDDKRFRQAAAEWIGEKAGDIAGSERMLGEAVKALVKRANHDSDEYTCKSAAASLKKIWDAGWQYPNNPGTWKMVIVEQVVRALGSMGEKGSRASLAAVDWLGWKAAEIAQEERLIYEALDALIEAIEHMSATDQPKALQAIWDIWNEAWKAHAQGGMPRQTVLNQVIKALKTEDGTDDTQREGNYRKVREKAAEWMGEKAGDIAADARMATDALNVLFNRIIPEEQANVRRTAREASRKIWDEVWKAEPLATASEGSPSGQEQAPSPTGAMRQIILNQVLRGLEKSADPDFRQAATNWLRENAGGLAKNYELAERVADTLAGVRDDRAETDELRDSASQALAALWDALQEEMPLDNIQKEFDQLKAGDGDKMIRTLRQLTNPNTLGSREAVKFLVEKWAEWIANKEENSLVEMVSERIRYNDHAILPLVEQFRKSLGESQAEVQRWVKINLPGVQPQPEPESEEVKAEKRLRLRRRVVRQLADMSDPRFYDLDQEALRDSILKELRDHAVQPLVQRLPEENDVDLLENMARVLLYSKEREGIDALAREVVGEERTHKARQELLAEYYLKPSKERSEQAAGILRDAVLEANRTLRILQTLNTAVFIVGAFLFFYGLYISLWSEDVATRLAGGLAAFGGLVGIYNSLVRDPLKRIQNANSNLVQMETAFTSFIWELNLNGTFIQSCYVNRGELSRDEINSTDERIEEAMKRTMSLVSIYTEENRQSLVTRLNQLEPAAGKAGNTEITIYGQFLTGEPRPDGETLGQKVKQRVSWPASQATPPAGMVAVNHLPIDDKAIRSWKEDAVVFNLPDSVADSGAASASNQTLWISLFVDGMETNALPFFVLQENGAGGSEHQTPNGGQPDTVDLRGGSNGSGD